MDGAAEAEGRVYPVREVSMRWMLSGRGNSHRRSIVQVILSRMPNSCSFLPEFCAEGL